MAEYCKSCKDMADQITELHKQGNALLLEAAKDRQEIERLEKEIDLMDDYLAVIECRMDFECWKKNKEKDGE